MSKWFQNQRQTFIGRMLNERGWVRRTCLQEAFDISLAQASVDLRTYIEAHPTELVYDKHRMAYVRLDQVEQEC